VVWATAWIADAGACAAATGSAELVWHQRINSSGSKAHLQIWRNR